jgi:RNA polymerase sigma-70 factor, ECF subfamily
MRRERSDHTLQPTALVHETYLRLIKMEARDLKDRAHFFATAAVVMRRILIDHARRKALAKKGGGLHRVDLEDFLASTHPQNAQLLILDQALTRLSNAAPRQGRLVEMIYFGGLNTKEVATVLEISERTVRRDWKVARAWLQAELRGNSR